jgi:hypothetical protein
MKKHTLVLAFLLMLTSITVFAKGDKNATSDKIAYGSVKFGASASEYNKEISDSVQQIGNHKYIFRPKFVDDKLVQLDIVTTPQDAREFKEGGAIALNSLVETLTAQLGQPKHFWTIPAMGAFQTGRKELVADWELGNKKIDAYAIKDYYQSFWGICSITTQAK